MDKEGFVEAIELVKMIVIFLMGYVILKALGITI